MTVLTVQTSTRVEEDSRPPDLHKNGATTHGGQAVKEEDSEWVTFQQIRWYYPNLIDYGRFVLCCIATFCVCGTWNYPWVTAFVLYVAFILDVYDGKVARDFKQCSRIGDGLDWLCDLFGDLLFTLWWGKLEPALMPVLLIVYMLEVGAALVDFSIHSSGRYPPRGVQTGFCIILQWSTPNNKYSTFGWCSWLSYPPFVLARILWLQGCALQWLLLLVQVVLFVPAMLYLWWNVALLFGGLGQWTEPDQNRGKKAA